MVHLGYNCFSAVKKNERERKGDNSIAPRVQLLTGQPGLKKQRASSLL